MYAFEIVAERKIQEAIERGEFDNNPLAGKVFLPEYQAKIMEKLK